MCLACDARNSLSISERITYPLKIKRAHFLDVINLGLTILHNTFFCQEPGEPSHHTDPPGGLLGPVTLRERTSQRPF